MAPRLEAYRRSQQEDQVCNKVRQYCQEGWPDRRFIKPDIRPFWKARASLTLHRELLLFQCNVLPPVLQRETLDKIHEGHQGIQQCRLRVKSSIWWPGIMNQLTQRVQHCSICRREAATTSEPLMLTPLLDYPWQVLGSDIFQLRGVNYLLLVDYFSQYPEVVKLTCTTSPAITATMKVVFSRHGIPEILQTDNGSPGVPRVLRDVQIPSHNQYPQIPPKQWASQTSCSNHATTDKQTALRAIW